MYVYVSLCIFICMFIYIYIYTYVDLIIVVLAHIYIYHEYIVAWHQYLVHALCLVDTPDGPTVTEAISVGALVLIFRLGNWLHDWRFLR